MLNFLNARSINMWTRKIFTLFLWTRHPISSMVFGTNALITKPANSLSPMLVVSILNRFGYGEVRKLTSGKMNDNDVARSEELKMAMFALVCWYPVVMGVIQLCSWSFFRINKRTEIIIKADKIHQGVWCYCDYGHTKSLIYSAYLRRGLQIIETLQDF